MLALADRDGRRNHALELVAADVVLADAEIDNRRAIEWYQSLDRENPLLKVRIMRRQWLLALSIFQEKQKPDGDISGLEEASGNESKELDDLLFALQQSGESLLKVERSPAIVWRAHNLLGASFLLQAVEALDRDPNLKRSQAYLGLAIGHFKEAITWIDKDHDARDMGNIPRWNLELLSTRKNLSQLVMTRTGAESKLDLKKNLATMLPESAGYMVGEPPDSRIRK